MNFRWEGKVRCDDGEEQSKAHASGINCLNECLEILRAEFCFAPLFLLLFAGQTGD